MSADHLQSREAFLHRHPWPALLARMPGPETPRKFSSKEASAATREVAKLKPYHPDSTLVYSLEKLDKNSDPRIVIGRGVTADVVINHDSISKHHAAFDGTTFVDLASMNGTHMRDNELQLGEVKLEFFTAVRLFDLLMELK